MWKRILSLFGGDGTATNPGLKPILDDIRTLLDTLDAIAAAEDLDALRGMEPAIAQIGDIAERLTAVVTAIRGDGTLTNTGIVVDIANLIGSTNTPGIIRPRPDGSGRGFPAQFWTLREFLSWRRTGRFAQKLWAAAQASGRDELVAYALGWISGWALATGGASAIASIIGAPYRNEWWRARFVGNHVDLWAWGHATVGPATKPYDAWSNLCEAELQKTFEVPGAGFDPDAMMQSLLAEQPLGSALPDWFTDFFIGAYDDVYGDLGPRRPKLDAAILQDGYAMTWLVLWFQSSAQSIGCHASAPAAPGACADPPAWTTPTVAGGPESGGITTPPAPEIDPKIKPENIVCAIILAILGVASILTGGIVTGGAAIAGAIALAIDAGTIDWAKFRCDLAWYRLYLYNALRALQEVLMLGALVHPYKNQIDTPETVINLLGGLLEKQIRTGDNIVMSNPTGERFPAEPWDGSLFSWFDPPSRAIEGPGAVATYAAAYPSGFINDPANPFGSASVFDPAEFPFAPSTVAQMPAGFRNAADAVADWLVAGGDIPDRNADGDRGLDFVCWEFVDGNWSNPVNIRQES
ncbi:hypothetical protein [Porphyrobacter sp. ULC335]|uniref:hypothetical protein n=1 Tax=Porphyrobacter sp. ULC335 TaxID=2854260 RepID=UPI00221F9750|nr:hypothetical protein [Porphyrobacter sp. ULC335]UYV16645.1 hypothetical protein KVF90_04810 [Porphyrobacter sp. ULC335]